MRYRRLGRALVSEISFGAWVLGGMYGRIEGEEARRLVEKAVDLGINLFDAADVYGAGAAERALGSLLAGREVYVTTKVGYDFSGPRPVRRYDPAYVKRAIEASVERLGRRPLAILMHNPTAEDVEGGYAGFAALAKQYADLSGVALGPETDVLEQGLAALRAGAEALMFVFNALEQDPALELIERGAGRYLMARVPHATGALATRAAPITPGDHRSLRDPAWLKAAREVAEREIAPLAKELGLTLSQYALKYVLSYPIATVVVTATSPEELEEFAEASDGRPLPEDHLAKLREIYLSFKASLQRG
nr:MAG: aldo/keto reductase [Thermoproteus sp. AZ2]